MHAGGHGVVHGPMAGAQPRRRRRVLGNSASESGTRDQIFDLGPGIVQVLTEQPDRDASGEGQWCGRRRD